MPETPEGLIERYEELGHDEPGRMADLFVFRNFDYEIMQWSRDPVHVDND